MLLPIWGYSSLWKKRRQKIIIYHKNLSAFVFAMSSPAYNVEDGMRHDLIDFVVFAVIGFQRGACKAHICSGNSASRRPDRRTADDAFCAVVLCFECLPESFHQFFFVHILIGSDCHFSKFFYRDWMHDRPFLCVYFCLLPISYHEKERLHITFMKYRAISLFLSAL